MNLWKTILYNYTWMFLFAIIPNIILILTNSEMNNMYLFDIILLFIVYLLGIIELKKKMEEKMI